MVYYDDDEISFNVSKKKVGDFLVLHRRYRDESRKDVVQVYLTGYNRPAMHMASFYGGPITSGMMYDKLKSKTSIKYFIEFNK